MFHNLKTNVPSDNSKTFTLYLELVLYYNTEYAFKSYAGTPNRSDTLPWEKITQHSEEATR